MIDLKDSSIQAYRATKKPLYKVKCQSYELFLCFRKCVFGSSCSLVSSSRVGIFLNGALS